MIRLVLLSILFSLSACQRQESGEESLSKSAEPVDEGQPTEPVVVMEGSVRRDGTIILQKPDGQDSLLTGEWVEKNGSRFCNGYMTRVESEVFCVSEIPEDWVPFEFEGQTYFVQPLADP